MRQLEASLLDIIDICRNSNVVELSQDCLSIRKRCRGINNDFKILGFSKEGI